MPIEIKLAYDDMDQIRLLFQEYTNMLGIDLGFQNYDAEFSSLPGDYALPDGRLYLAVCDGQPAGCIALHPFDRERCEMKRLFVRPEFRGERVGRALAERAIADAKEMRYQAIVLDTMAFLTNSVALYRKLGFQETLPYRYNPLPDALFLRLDL
ncbi:MAG: GNAT family N-acetyltransferase [Clostridiales bacterium]|nr:GNAT family N-acetyltransferase [Clostridiales bacterium]